MIYSVSVIRRMFALHGHMLTFEDILANSSLDYCTADNALRMMVQTGALLCNCSCTTEDATVLDGLVFVMPKG